MNRLKAKYNEEIVPSLKEQFNYTDRSNRSRKDSAFLKACKQCRRRDRIRRFHSGVQTF